MSAIGTRGRMVRRLLPLLPLLEATMAALAVAGDARLAAALDSGSPEMLRQLAHQLEGHPQLQVHVLARALQALRAL
jgi:hypothetical protein